MNKLRGNKKLTVLDKFFVTTRWLKWTQVAGGNDTTQVIAKSCKTLEELGTEFWETENCCFKCEINMSILFLNTTLWKGEKNAGGSIRAEAEPLRSRIIS